LDGDGSAKNLGGYTVITGTIGVGREGIDQRQFRVEPPYGPDWALMTG
jgi:hypothetical protein